MNVVLETFAIEAGADQDKVILLGNTKNIAWHYNNAKVFAFTSIFEGFPNALIEAMHFGLPCISTDCPTGPSELINNGENGFLIPENNETLFTNKLKDLMYDATLYQSISESGQLFAAEYDIKVYADRLINIYKN